MGDHSETLNEFDSWPFWKAESLQAARSAANPAEVGFVQKLVGELAVWERSRASKHNIFVILSYVVQHTNPPCSNEQPNAGSCSDREPLSQAHSTYLGSDWGSLESTQSTSVSCRTSNQAMLSPWSCVHLRPGVLFGKVLLLQPAFSNFKSDFE